MKIYVAGSWKNRKDIKLTWIEPLIKLGHEITHDWTEMEDERLDEIGHPLRDIDYHKMCAQSDVNGVINADVLIVVMDSAVKHYSYRGTWTEIGVAIGKSLTSGKDMPIILYNPWIDDEDINEMAKYSRNVTNVFFWHDKITRVTTGNAVFRELKKLENSQK